MLLFIAFFSAITSAALSHNYADQSYVDRFTSKSGQNYVKGSIWPKPLSEQRNKENVFTLNPEDFTFQILGKESDVLSAAVKRYRGLIFPDKDVDFDSSKNKITTLGIDVLKDYEPLGIKTDESYSLNINDPKSLITANTVWGALRGLETFSQAVYQDLQGVYYAEENAITDKPRYNHRGFLIDSSRHFLSLDIILKFLDAMSYSKYNVLHWHIVDDQSFPYVSKKFPTLSDKGAWNNKTHIYTPGDVQTVIEYARMRGIRVMPEFDSPGHTLSWFSIKNFLTKCYKEGKPDGTNGPIDPTNEDNYQFLKEFFQEVAQVFPDKYIHLGGDEVSFDCWKSNPNIVRWMEAQGMGANFSKLEEYYEQKLLDIVGALGKHYVIWQEVVDNKVKVRPDTVVNVWKDGWKKEMKKVTGQGLQVILSAPWYLNYIKYGPDWETYYKVEPDDFGGTPEELDLVLGGTACVWGRWADSTDLLSIAWARGLSVGERLWSPKHVNDIREAEGRIWEHRCRYVRRGIPAQCVIRYEYCRYEWMNKRGTQEKIKGD